MMVNINTLFPAVQPRESGVDQTSVKLVLVNSSKPHPAPAPPGAGPEVTGVKWARPWVSEGACVVMDEFPSEEHDCCADEGAYRVVSCGLKVSWNSVNTGERRVRASQLSTELRDFTGRQKAPTFWRKRQCPPPKLCSDQQRALTVSRVEEVGVAQCCSQGGGRGYWRCAGRSGAGTVRPESRAGCTAAAPDLDCAR